MAASISERLTPYWPSTSCQPMWYSDRAGRISLMEVLAKTDSAARNRSISWRHSPCSSTCSSSGLLPCMALPYQNAQNRNGPSQIVRAEKRRIERKPNLAPIARFIFRCRHLAHWYPFKNVLWKRGRTTTRTRAAFQRADQPRRWHRPSAASVRWSGIPRSISPRDSSDRLPFDVAIFHDDADLARAINQFYPNLEVALLGERRQPRHCIVIEQ